MRLGNAEKLINKATLVGFGAILLWSLLATLTVATRPVPPFQLNALCFSIGTLAGLVWMKATGQRLTILKNQPPSLWLTGILGLFGYHAFYFTALRLAPAAEASLIAYLWPLLIVLLSGLLPGESLRRGHVIGAVLAFVGAALIVASGIGFTKAAWAGYAAALICAFTWSGYSILLRRYPQAPTASVVVFCAGGAALSLLTHLLFESPAWPASNLGWLAILLLGAGPVGAAFYLWDIGVKNGNIQMLATASYAAPVLSTLLLVAATNSTATVGLLLAALLVTTGAVIASRA